MIKIICSKCGKKIPTKTRFIKGKLGGTYHVHCGSHLKDKEYGWTKK